MSNVKLRVTALPPAQTGSTDRSSAGPLDEGPVPITQAASPTPAQVVTAAGIAWPKPQFGRAVSPASTVTQDGKALLYALPVLAGTNAPLSGEHSLVGSQSIEPREIADPKQEVFGDVLTTLALLAESGGLSIDQAEAALAAATQQHPEPLKALLLAATMLREQTTPGAELNPTIMMELQDTGFVDKAELLAVMQKLDLLFPPCFKTVGETALFALLGAPQEVLVRFNACVLAGQGSPAAWQQAAADLVEAIPTSLTPQAGSEPQCSATFLAMERSPILAGARVRLRQALALSDAKVGAMALQSTWSTITPTHVALFEQSLANSSDLVGALLSTLDTLVLSGDMPIGRYSDLLGLDRFGLCETNSPQAAEIAARVQAHLPTAQYRAIVASVVRAVSSPDKSASSVEAAIQRLDSVLSQGQDLNKALAAAFGTIATDQQNAALSAWQQVRAFLPATFDVLSVFEALSESFGKSRHSFVLDEALKAIHALDLPNMRPLLDQYRRAFQTQEQAGGDIVSCLRQANEALLAESISRQHNLPSSLDWGPILTDAEAASLVLQQPLHNVYSLAALVREALEGAHPDTLTEVMLDLSVAAQQALGAEDPVEAMLAKMRRIQRPRGGRIGYEEPPFYYLDKIPSLTQRAEIFAEALRLRHATPTSYLQDLMHRNFDHMGFVADVDRQKLKADMSAQFVESRSLFEACMAAIKLQAQTMRQPVSSTLSYAFSSGAFVVPDDWAEQLRAAQQP